MRATTWKPDGFRSVTPYLFVRDVRDLISFLIRAFDAEELARDERPDGTIGHAEVRIGDSLIELSEARDEFPARPAALHLYVPDADGTYARALGAGATSLFPPADRAYGDREAGVSDPSGNLWFIATRVEHVPPEEVARRLAGDQR